MNMLRYFGYGSNLNRRHLSDWMRSYGVCPEDVQVVGRGILHDFILRTNYLRTGRTGAANIEPHRRGRVEGVVYRISPEAWMAIRRKEGNLVRYAEVIVAVALGRGGRIVPALTYSVTPEYRLAWDAPVSSEYRRLVLDGADEHRLSPAYRRRLSKLLRVTGQNAR